MLSLLHPSERHYFLGKRILWYSNPYISLSQSCDPGEVVHMPDYSYLPHTRNFSGNFMVLTSSWGLYDCNYLN